MVFPFTFNFSVPGILNPFGKVFPSSNPPASEQQNKKQHRRNHQSPADSCQPVPNRRSQAEYIDRDPAPDYSSPAYPTSTSFIASPSTNRLSRAHLPKIQRRPSPSPTPSSLRPLPLSRKRRWEPTFGSESIQSLTGNGKTGSTTSLTLASTSGYLDTPAKYRDMAEDITMSDDIHRENEQTQEDEDAPPLKKRRGLAGSIVSTAVSAALIGTAVGLTVYRLWRDRGKEGQFTHPASASGPSTPRTPDSDQQMPPPPYDPGAWKAIDQPPAMQVTTIQPRSNFSGTQRSAKSKKVAASSKRAVGGGGHHHHHSSSGSTRRSRARYVAGGGGGVVGSPRTRPEFDFGRVEVEDADVGGGVEQTEVEDKMDWIGDKLSMLIEQGRRALQSEVVVMSEAQEDEVDDGRGGWEEEASGDDGDDDGRSINGQSPARSIRSRSGSVRAKGTKPRPRNIVPPPPSSGVGLGLYGARTSASGSLSASPRRSGFAPSAPGSAYGSPSTSYTPVSAAFVPSSAPSSVSRINGHVRGASYESALPAPAAEDSAAWESPELRESMERARARLLAARRGAAAGS